MKESIKTIVENLNKVRECIDHNKLALINNACHCQDKADLSRIFDDINILNKSTACLDELCSNITLLIR